MLGNIEQNSKNFKCKHLKLLTDWIEYIQTVNDIILIMLRKNKFHLYLIKI